MELGLVEATVDELVFTLSQAQQSIGNIEKHQKMKKPSKNCSHWEEREKLSFCEVSQAHVKIESVLHMEGAEAKLGGKDPILHGGGATVQAASCFPVNCQGFWVAGSVESIVWRIREVEEDDK
ncbi:hypothetical protein FH972_011550 [Carpinus fangiana]|uniref:Uncharacterized protein n=1 Tax=Carpinus fangiana TaxID=176857 RepID=A0A660KUQ5_9ROSI|nr:hypothetical protein FH972_011550 [Carpinus fangiana]